MDSLGHLTRAEAAVRTAEAYLPQLVANGNPLVAAGILSFLRDVRSILSLGYVPSTESVEKLEAALEKAAKHLRRRVPRESALVPAS